MWCGAGAASRELRTGRTRSRASCLRRLYAHAPAGAPRCAPSAPAEARRRFPPASKCGLLAAFISAECKAASLQTAWRVVAAHAKSATDTEARRPHEVCAILLWRNTTIEARPGADLLHWQRTGFQNSASFALSILVPTQSPPETGRALP